MKKVFIYLSILLISLLPMNLTALQEDNNGADSTKSGSQTTYGHWANYGTILKYNTCTTLTVSLVGGVPTLTYEYTVKATYFLLENCDLGGNECTFGTSRKTYQGGGC